MRIELRSRILGFVGIWYVCLTVALADAKAQRESPQTHGGLSATEYSDPKGFFRIRPPAGWRIQQYATDPRGKVKFVCPENSNLTFMITAMPTGMSNFKELLADSKAQAERVERKYNATVTTETTTFDDAPAAQGTMSLRGQFKQRGLEFLRGKIYYNLSFAGPPDLFDKYSRVIESSINSFDPQIKEVTEEAAIAVLVYGKKRGAELNLQNGFPEVALRFVEEGLSIDPDNSELKELKSLIIATK